MDFVNKDLGYAFVSKDLFGSFVYSNYFIKTLNGGLTWSNFGDVIKINFPDWISIRYVDFFDSLNGIAGGSNSIILRTSDGGTTWNQEYLPFKTLNYEQSVQSVYYYENFMVAEMTEIFTFLNLNSVNLKTPQFHRIINSEFLPIDKIIFKWESIEDAVSYRLKIDSISKHETTNDYSQNFMNSFIDTIIKDTVFELNITEPNKKYKCNVQALSDFVESDWSRQYIVSTLVNDTVLFPPEVIYPELGQNIYGDSIRIKWSSVKTADSYSLIIYDKISLEEYFNNIIFDTTFMLTNLKPNSIYYIELSSRYGDKKSEYLYPEVTFFVTDVVLSIENSKAMGSIKTYPNPTSTEVNIEYNSNEISKAFIEIYDLLGIKRIEIEEMLFIGKNLITLNIKNLESGLYFISFSQGGTKKFIKPIVIVN